MKKTLTPILLLFLILWGGEEFFRRKVGGIAGSYPFVETWTINSTDSALLNIIRELKINNPDLQPPLDSNLIRKKYSYWTYIDFYNKETDEILHTWITTTYEGSSKTTLALYSIEQNGQEKLINRDYWIVANFLQKRKFKNHIIDKLKEKTNID